MVFYSTKSNEKVFHLPHCKIARRIRKEYKKQFASPEEVRAAGYRMCNCCSLVGMRLRKEQKAVNQFCQGNGVSCWLEDGQLHIHTSKSKWKIIVNGKANKLFLYHKNTYHKYEEIPSIVPGYHSQAIRSKTIVGYLEYIIRHDIYRRRQAKKAKQKADSMRNLRRNTRPYQRGTKKGRINCGQLPMYHAEDSHEAIISMMEFQATQETRKERAAVYAHAPDPTVVYPFRGKLVCMDCGKNYRRKMVSRGPAWVCGTYNAKGKEFCPTSKVIPEETLRQESWPPSWKMGLGKSPSRRSPLKMQNWPSPARQNYNKAFSS